jgi:hypothetical protein
MCRNTTYIVNKDKHSMHASMQVYLNTSDFRLHNGGYKAFCHLECNDVKSVDITLTLRRHVTAEYELTLKDLHGVISKKRTFFFR